MFIHKTLNTNCKRNAYASGRFLNKEIFYLQTFILSVGRVETDLFLA